VILLWETEEDVRNREKHKFKKVIAWIVDGQQRITTLSKIFKGEDPEVVFNPHDENMKFQIRNRITDNAGYFHVSDVFDDNEYAVKRAESSDKMREILDRLRSIRDYEVPVIKMIGHTIEEAQEAFQRINQSGMKLKGADIYASSIATAHKSLIAEKLLHSSGNSVKTALAISTRCIFSALVNLS
jgi:uncharacterized protein involved in tolerance to divalent cations